MNLELRCKHNLSEHSIGLHERHRVRIDFPVSMNDADTAKA